MLNAQGALTNEQPGALSDRVQRSTFADSGNASVRFDFNNMERLIEDRPRIRRSVKANACNLHLCERCPRTLSAMSARQSNSTDDYRLKKASALHGASSGLKTDVGTPHQTA
jgi:hypothetical protein